MFPASIPVPPHPANSLFSSPAWVFPERDGWSACPYLCSWNLFNMIVPKVAPNAQAFSSIKAEHSFKSSVFINWLLQEMFLPPICAKWTSMQNVDCCRYLLTGMTAWCGNALSYFFLQIPSWPIPPPPWQYSVLVWQQKRNILTPLVREHSLFDLC